MKKILNMSEEIENLLEEFEEKEGIYGFIKDAPLKYIEQQKHGYSAILDMIYNDHEKGNSSNLILISQLIEQTTNYLEKTALAAKDKKAAENALKFKYLSQEILIPFLGKRLEEAIHKSNLGVFTLGLVIFGSSANEAFLSMAEWTSTSKTTIETCYHNAPFVDFWRPKTAQSSFKHPKDRQQSFMLTHDSSLLRVLMHYKENKFPERNKKSEKHKTYEAFAAIKEWLTTQT